MLTSYKNDNKLKKDFIAEIEKHRKADQIIQGTYGKQNGEWSGCAVACSVRSMAILKGEKLKTEYQDHKRYETDLGIPQWLAHLEDTIFEGLPKEDAVKWPTQFARAIPVGVDLESVKWKFSAYLIRENIKRVKKLENLDEDVRKEVIDASNQVLKVHTDALKTGEWDESAAESAARSAWSAGSAARSAAWSAESAAWSAARSAWSAARSAWSAESAAWSAARSAWSAARSAAWSAESAAWSAARSAWSAAYKKHSKQLLKMLKEAK